ncbi:MAG: TetR/AcrR family transcriptional regulator [Actinobacteria bacterium]|nr:TetR/AcrR family transcriptional regulator [Actinomycetota bacterium]
MAARATSTNRRDPEGSRRKILDAAELVFARAGYEGATLAEVGREAGMSGTLPSYFFGDKDGLYDAVISRLFGDRDAALEAVCADAVELAAAGGPAAARAALDRLVGGYVEFAERRPAFVQVMTRDAIDHERRGRVSGRRHSAAFQESVERIAAAFVPAPGPATDLDQLVISLIALCLFPLEHDSTLLAGMGYVAHSPGFSERRVAHIVDLVSRALTP